VIPLVTAQAVAFWVFAPLAVAGALGMVLSRKPVHSALSIAGMMVALGCLYASLDAPFLFVAQIIVYTGAVMMLFLFTMMIVGVDTTDSLIETLRGQRFLAGLLVFGFAVLLVLAVGNSVVEDAGFPPDGENVPSLAQIVFSNYVFAFELTAALLVIATLAAIVLAHGERLKKAETQRQRVARKVREFADRGVDPGPLPGPGSYARHNSIEYPALLPDGRVAEHSVSPALAVRGVAVVENDGLRQAHKTALTRFVAVIDENQGGDRVALLNRDLDDNGPRQLPAADEEATR